MFRGSPSFEARSRTAAEDLICFSHLRWDFVYQRPHHLMSRAVHDRRVYYVEEPAEDVPHPWLETRPDLSGVTIVLPHVRRGSATEDMRALGELLFSAQKIERYIAWYYTPMALEWASALPPAVATVYDCMDELSAFAGAPSGLKAAERRLLDRADLVLTGGHSLYLAKRPMHGNVHEFPSSVDVPHFARARATTHSPADQAHIPAPRIGFFGVLDERLDRELLAAIAERRPDWHFIMIGPVTKINPATLPNAANVHYLGPKPYATLPDYIAGWNVAMMPFARNEATRYISPTKTPEYLAAGRPVVSTSIADVVTPYGELGLAYNADTPDAFVDAIGSALHGGGDDWLARSDSFLAGMSWDRTWSRISERLRAATINRHAKTRAHTDLSAAANDR
jgi:UDP-galactopyranose mutase